MKRHIDEKMFKDWSQSKFLVAHVLAHRLMINLKILVKKTLNVFGGNEAFNIVKPSLNQIHPD